MAAMLSEFERSLASLAGARAADVFLATFQPVLRAFLDEHHAVRRAVADYYNVPAYITDKNLDALDSTMRSLDQAYIRIEALLIDLERGLTDQDVK